MYNKYKNIWFFSVPNAMEPVDHMDVLSAATTVKKRLTNADENKDEMTESDIFIYKIIFIKRTEKNQL